MSKWSYYLSSIPTLLGGIRNWGSLARLLFRAPGSEPLLLELRNGLRFKVRSLMDVWIIKETCLDRAYEDRSLPIREKGIVMDIGAGLGDFTILLAREHPQARIIAYEPFAESFQLLQENLVLNRVANVQAFPCAIGACSGPMKLQVSSGVAVQHSTAAAPEEDRGESTIQVEGYSLDDVFKSQKISRCDLLKVDCEGGEYDIFFHASQDTLRRIDNIRMEYHDHLTDHSHAELAAFLQDHGFSVKIRLNPVHRYIGLLNATKIQVKA